MFLLYTIIGLLAVFWLYVWHSFRYWKVRGVPYIEPHFPYGTVKIPGDPANPAILSQRFYNEMKGRFPFVGTFNFTKPSVLLLDLDLIKQILIKDFNHFMDRGIYFNEKDDPLSAHLFNMEGQIWRRMRAKLSAIFTSGKMKYMFPTVVKVAYDLRDKVDRELKKNSEIEMKDIFARFTTDVIANIAFGLDCNCLKDPNAIFRQMGRHLLEEPRLNRILTIFLMTFRDWGRRLGFKSFHDREAEYFKSIVIDTMENREKTGEERKDFLELLLKIRDKNDENLTMVEAAAQAFVFYLAGFDTSSTAMSFCLYELAINTEIQDKVRKEIKDVLGRYNGELTYDALKEMTYLDWCINESMRKYAPLPMLNRIVTEDYKVPGTDVTLPKGMFVIIPNHGIHHDPEYYPNPDEYDPERFSPEEVAKRHPFSFLAFGEGPRLCIGLRFGVMQAKIGLAILFDNFRFKVGPKTKIPLTIETKTTLMSPKGGVHMLGEHI